MSHSIPLLILTLFTLSILLLVISKKISKTKNQFALLCIIVLLLLSSLLFILFHQGFFSPSKGISINNIDEENIIGTVDGTSSCFIVYLDPSTGAPDYVLSTNVDDGHIFSTGQIIYESTVDRYSFRVIESTEKKDYYILISGVVIEDIVGKVGDVIIEDSIDSQFSIFRKSEQVSEHIQTRIIAFSSLNSWDEKTYTLTVTDDFGPHKN